MAETESTDQKQSGTEQQRGLPIEPGEEIQKAANAPPRPGPVSEVPDQQPDPDPNVPIQKSADLTDLETRTAPSQTREISNSSNEGSDE